MAEPVRSDPFARLADRFAGSRPDARLAPSPPLAMVSLRLRRGRHPSLPSAVGCPLPDPGRAVDGEFGPVLGLGPDEWLVVGADGRQGRIEAALRTALGEGSGAVVDLSASRVALTLAGAGARDVLATCVALDFHPSRFGPGRCAETLLAKAPVLIHQLDAEPSYRIVVRNSYLGYVVDWLADGTLGTGLPG